MKNEKAIVLFSGGQDSTTCLVWALSQYKEVEALTIMYGQRHANEAMFAEAICHQLDVPLTIVETPFLKDITASALMDSTLDLNASHSHNPGLPASFVPNRNALFLTIAHAYAQKVYATVVVAGMCETDYSGYPDCREKFIKELELALMLGSEAPIDIITPLMHLTKSQTWQMSEDLGCYELVLWKSNTCYAGVRSRQHPWGYGCGECAACKLRAKGWNEYWDSKN